MPLHGLAQHQIKGECDHGVSTISSHALESRRKCTIRYDSFDTLFLTTVSPLKLRFPLIMAASSFGSYHRLWTDDAPSKPIGFTPTPWAMMPVLGLGVSLVLALAYDTYDTALYLSVLFSSQKTVRKTINMHLLQMTAAKANPHPKRRGKGKRRHQGLVRETRTSQ